jgi:hypothetical protein
VLRCGCPVEHDIEGDEPVGTAAAVSGDECEVDAAGDGGLLLVEVAGFGVTVGGFT